MKTLKLFMVLAGVLLMVGLQAQTRFGVRVAGNMSNVKFDVDEADFETDSKIGLDVAGILNFGLSDELSLQPEIHFVQNGYKFEFEFFDEKIESVTGFNYLQIPVLFKYSFGEDIKFFPQAGPYVGYMLSGYVDADGEKETFDFDDEDGLSRIDYGVVAGAGVGFMLGDLDLFVDVRYNLGLGNLIEDAGDDEKLTNNAINFGVGILF